MARSEPHTESLRMLFWREEILQVMFWIEGEGFANDMSPTELERFLGLDPGHATAYLEQLVTDGYLERVSAERYSLTALGRSDGARAFADEFADMTKPSHGECGSDCWCHSSVEEALACRADRVAGAHG